MLFNSFSFLLFFLPVTAVGFFLLSRLNHRVAAGWLTFASFLFYGWWDPRYVPLLLGSILFNFFAAQGILRSIAANRTQAPRNWLLFAVIADLALLAYFKYFNFFLDNFNALSGGHWIHARVVLPIGISFFTFTQIAFLVDTYRKQVSEYNLIHYGLFVTYFPHLVAGPVLHHKEMMPQFADPKIYRVRGENIAIGITIFAFGLFKKVVVADNFAAYVRPVFDAAAGQNPGLFDCWAGALAYTLQIYFDFSGYSDMAIGLSRLFGVKLPLNFNSPYKAESITEFWRRWHMTLSRFLRDYLYIPLGGNRKGTVRRYLNLLATMLLGGLWHGAGWSYIIWGGLHGAFLVIHQAWRSWWSTRRPAGYSPSLFGRIASVAITFIAVVVAWVFFRAENTSHATHMVAVMFGFDGITVPTGWRASVASIFGGVPFANSWINFGDVAVLQDRMEILAIIAGLLWVWFAPNAQEVMRRYEPALDFDSSQTNRRWQWQPTPAWAIASAALLVLAVANLTRVSDFLYFQF